MNNQRWPAGSLTLPSSLAMTYHLSCSQGHEWESTGDAASPPDGLAVCPECGLPAVLDSEASVGEASPETECELPPPPVATPRTVNDLALQLLGEEKRTAVWPEIAGYTIVERIGRGAMGVVYKALHDRSRRWVALKVMRHGADADPAERERFRVEAESAASLQHPHIVAVYDVGDTSAGPYLSQELLGGGTLQGRLSSGPLEASEAALLVESLARAVQHAHERGVVHRDLKPGNILLTLDGQAKITDFGLAKLLSNPDPGRTRPGQVMGTPGYMAPEQARGLNDQIGPAADVYSLGAILYEAMTGRPPFQGASQEQTLEMVRSKDPVPPRALVSSLPRDLETIALVCLAKDPRRRFASALELAEDLRRFLEGRPIEARPTGSLERTIKWARRQPAAAALVLVAAASAAGLIAGLAGYSHSMHEASVREQALARQVQAEWQEAVRLRQRAEVDRERALEALDTSDELQAMVVGYLASVHSRPAIRRDLLPQVVEAYEKAAQRAGEDPGVRLQRAWANRHLGELFDLLGDKNEAEASYEASLADFRRLAAEAPGEPRYSVHLERTLNHQGTLFKEARRWDQADASYAEALVQCRRLAGQFPIVPDHASDLGATLNNQARLRRDQGRIEESLSLLREAVESQKQAMAGDPARTLFHRFLRTHYVNLIWTLLDEGRTEEASVAAVDLAGDLEKCGYSQYEAACGLAEAARRDASRAESPDQVETIAHRERRALDFLGRAIELGMHDRSRIERESAFARLREREEFSALLKRLAERDAGQPS
jgi:tetratricopeptide (TPR) repeat protein